MRILIAFTFLFLNVLIVSSRRTCNGRDYGNGAIVCVCNTTYCDDLDPIVKTDKGVVKVFETSKSGDRFKETELKFGNTPTDKAVKSHTITLDKSKKLQKIIGFGGAFTDAAGINFAALPKELQSVAINDYFSKNGIEYTIGRIPIGGSDFSTHGYSYNDNQTGDFNLDHFALTKEDMDYKIPYLQMAQKVSPHKVFYFGSPWSSPAWMKDNNKLINGGLLIGKPGEKYYKTFANYFIKFLDSYKKNNVSVTGLTIENEPGAGYNPNYRWNSLGFNPELQRDFIKLDLGPALEKGGYGVNNVKLMIHDDQRPSVHKWAEVILKDKESAKYVAGSAFHWYSNNKENIVELDKTHEAFPNYFLLATEACEEWHGKSHHVSLGNWATFDRYAYDIITDLNHWTAGWTDWNLALDLEGGPNWVNNLVDAPIIVNATGHEYYKQPFFYALGHFSKFLIPDSQRIQVSAKDSLGYFETTAFVRPDNATVVIALNMNAESVELTINDTSDGLVKNVIKPHSLQSYIWYN